MRNFTVFRSDPRTSKTKRWLGLLTFCFGILMGQMSFAQTVTVGTGITTNTNVPTSSCWAYSFSQQIYTAAQIGMPDGGDIMKLRFYYDSSGTTYANWDEWTVYVANTTKTSFTSTTDWEPISNFTQVFSGEISVDPSGGWFDIDFSDTFDYTGGNLIIAVHENAPGYSCTPAYRVTTSDANTSMYVRRDGTDYDLSAISTVTASGRLGVVPQLQLVFPTTVIPNCAIDLFPADIATDVVRNPVLTWADNGGLATNYDVYFGTTTNPGFVTNVTSLNYTPVVPLDANTTYYWKVVPKNDIGEAIGCLEQTFTTGTSLLYCTSAPTSNDGSGITNVSMGSTSFAVTDVTYYNYTDSIIDITAGIENAASVTFATGYTYHTNIWIDLDDNGEFNNDDELVFQGESTNANPTMYDTSFMLNISAALGQHKMRIGTADSGQATPNPCYSGSYGVTIDMMVNILAPPPFCATPNAITSLALTPGSDSVSGVITPDGTASGYVVARTTTPTLADAPDNGVFYPVGEYEDGVVVVYNGTDTSFTDTSALPNTQYYYHVYAYNSDPDFDCLIVYSATSVTANTTTCVGTPIIVGESNVRTTGAVLNWTSALYADTTGVTYTVEVSTTPDFSIIYNTIFDLGVYSTSVSGLIPNATYYWRVKAVGTSCDSDWANSSFIAQSSYSPIAVTGFTDDVIADGIGDATTSTTNAVDAVDYAYMSNSFKVTASSNPITYALPVSRNLESPNIAGLNFIMPDYAYSNSLRLATQGQSGTLTFTEAFPLTDIYFAFTSGSGNSTMSAEILFDDSTSQLVTDIALTDWYGAGTATTPALIDNLGRVLRTTTATPSTGNAKIFQISIPIDQANHSKSVTGVTFTKTSTGAEPVANIFAISGKIIGVCPILGDTSVENETAFTADLNWTLSNAGAGSLPADVTYTIQLYADEDLTVPVGAPATGITTTTYAATDLSDQTTYYYTVTANNGTCDSATISGEFTTTCAVFATAFNEGFDTVPTGGTTNPSLPSCWSMIDTGAGYGYVSSTTPDSAPNNFYIYNSSDNSGDYILVSPETDNVGNGNYRIKFVARSGSNNYVLQVGTLSDNSDPTTFTLVESISLTSSNTEYTVVLPATTDDYFGFRHGLGGTYRSIYIDTITYQEIPTCPDVTDLVLSNPTADGTDIGWTGVGTSFDIEWGPKGYTPGIGEEIGSATAVSTNPYTISGLPGGNYSVYVRQNCDPAEAGYWAGPADFHLTMAGDDCSDPIVIASLPYMTTDDTANYTDNPAIEGSPGSSCGSTSSYLNGNDVVYSYTATFTGTIGVSITPTATYAGIFAYDSCANIGVECLGGVASSSASQKGFDLDVTEGSTYYFVISTWASPQTTGYVLEINPPACPEPTGLATADATTDSVELSWAGTSDSFDIEYGVSGFTPGTGTTVTGVTSPYVLSGLDDNTEYDVYVRGVCALNESDWVGSVTFTTLEDTTPVAPVCEIAVNLTFPEFGDATTWELLDGDGTAVLSGGPYSFWDYYDFTISEAILAINPPYSLEITIEDEYGDNEVSYSVTVGGTTDTNATGTIEVFGDDDIIVETVSIMACPTCPAPSNLGIANIATTSVDLTWTGTASAFDVEWGTAGFTPTGTPSTGFSGVTSPQALTGLTAMTSYDFYVRQDCGTDGTSAWTGPFNFTTPCETINTFPFTETFETDSASRDCWSNQFETGTTAWTYMAGAFSPLGAVTSANTGALNATFGMSSYTANVTKFVSPALNLSALTTPEVTFWYANQAWGGDQNELRVYYKTSANGTWELIPGAVYNTNVNEWTEVSLALPSPSSEYFIAFEGTNAYGYGIALDDVVVNDNIAPCEQPTDFVAANATFESVELTWTGTAGSYDIEYGAPGFTSGTGTTVTGVSSPYILSGLDDETQYDVYIKGVCGSISSDWAGPVTFTTLEIPPPNPCAIEVSFSSTGWGDATSWELIDGSGQVVLSGGTYGNNYSDTQTYLAVNPPYSLRVMITAYCDNNPTYNVTVGGVANISGTITDCSPVDVTIPLVGDLTPCIPACPAPTNLAVTGFTYESADLSWVSSGSLFDIEWGVAGFTPTGNPSTGLSGLTATSQTLTGLTAETHYEFYVRRDCDTDGTSTWAGPYAFFTGYCIPTTTYTYDGYGILGFSTTDGYTNISNENNGLVAGYSNYSNLAVTQSAGSSFNFSITVPGYTLAAIWIDLDQNLIFDPVSELLGTFEVSGTANTVFTGSMPIPPGTPNGDYRIRVRSHDVWNEETPTPCGEMFYGETEDYTLTVVDVPTCLPPSGLSATSLTLTTAELSWISAGTLFDIEWGVTGFTPTETPTVSGVANPYLLTTPVPGAYQFYVRQDCGTDGTSLWVGPYTVVVGAYSDGDIPTQHNTAPNVNSTDYCTPEATITIDVPAGMQIAGLQVQYSMTAHNGAYMSEQRSFIYSPTLNVGEASITSGGGTGGTYNYSRSMNFANGATGTVDFVLRAWRTWTAFEQPTDCNTNYNYVNNGTWVITPTFEPIPPCPTPLALSADVTEFTEAILSWTSTGTSFDIEYGEAGFTPTGTPSTGLTGVSNPYTLSGLTAETDYEYYVRQDCGTDGTSTWAGPFAFYTGYCIPTTTYTYDGYGILGFSTSDGYTNISNENNGLVAGYSNYSNLAVTQSAGNSFNFSITVPGSTFAAVWIDLNQDLIFDPVMETLGTFEGNTAYTGSIPIPAGTPNGDYRIRIRSYDAFNGETPTPCGEMFYGETEDYTLTVVDVPACLPPSGLMVDSVTFTSADVSWTSSGTLFDIEYGVAGFTPTGTPSTGYTGIANTFATITGLTPDTSYQFYVRQDCGTTDGTSLWAGPFSFYTGYCQVTTTNTGDYISAFSTTGATENVTYVELTYPGAYVNQSAQIVEQAQGLSFNFSSNYIGGNQIVNIWIDWNNDMMFDDSAGSTEKVYSEHMAGAIQNGIINIPVGTPLGNYRMRVRAQYSFMAGDANPAPCGEVAWGSTVDFTLSVTPAPSCLPPTALTATTTADSATLGWTSTGTLFDIEYGATGFTPTGTPTVAGVANPYILTATPGAYQFYVRQDCGDGDTSLWTGPYTFIIGSYTGGDIPTQYNAAASVTSTDYCTPEATLTIEVPAGYEIASLQVMYAMTAHGGAYMSEQRSFIYSPTLSAGETDLALGAGFSGGTFNYNRALTFANGATGTVDFVLRAWRTWGGTDCGTTYNYINNGTWVLIPTFVEIPCDAVTPTGDAAQSLTLGDTLADLDVTGDDLVWYSDEDLTVEIPETTVAVDGTIYYVVSETDTCQSDALAITVTVIDPCAGVTAPTGATEQSLLLGQTIAGLNVAGNNLVWYSDEDLTIEIPETTTAVDGTTYYVVSETDTCQSDALAIIVTVIDPCAQITTPTGDAEQTLEEGDTLADLVVNGDNLAWYSDADLTISIPATTVAQDGVTYYVASVTDICQSEGLAITVTISMPDPCEGVEVPAPTGDENQTLNDGQTLADLIVEGENLQWYADEDLTEPLEETHVVENNTTYYVTQATEDGCTSEAFAVTVTTLSTTDFEVFAFSFYPNPVSEVLQLTSNSEITQIDLFNMLGQKVNVFANANNTQVDMSGLPTGNYIISVTIEGITKTFKVVKN